MIQPSPLTNRTNAAVSPVSASTNFNQIDRRMKSPVNLNNLDTSLTKELDRSVLSALNSKKAEDRPQLKYDPKKADSSFLEKSINEEILKGNCSPVNIKNPLYDVVGHTRHGSIPDPLESKKADKENFNRTTTNVTSRTINEKDPRDRELLSALGFTTPRQIIKSHTPSNSNVNRSIVGREKLSEFNNSVADDIIYECPESAREEKQTIITTTNNTTQSSFKQDKKETVKKSPSPLGRTETQSTSAKTSNSTSAAYQVYKASQQNARYTTKNVDNAKYIKTDVSIKTEESIDRPIPIKDNFVASPISKYSVSPRGLSPSRENNPLYNSVQHKVAQSLQFTNGVFKESSNLVDRLTNYTRKIPKFFIIHQLDSRLILDLST
jgi:hypothetical protein